MDIEFGYVQEYNVERGFGYVSRTFGKSKRKYGDINRRHRDGLWFHIKRVKHDYPDVAKELDAGLFTSISFWYELDRSDNNRINVGQIWVDPKDIPKQKRDDLIAYIEQQWCVASVFPEWLDSVTLLIVGEARRNELKQLYDEQIRQQKEAEEQKHLQRQARIEQRKVQSKNDLLSARDRFRSERNKLKKLYDEQIRQQKEAEEQKHLQRQARIEQRKAQSKNDLLSARDRFRSERGVIEAIFASNEMHGLPPELQRIVRPCPRRSRTNPLSHQPGGNDVVVAYSLGDAILYDWIKNVNWYISSFEREDPGFHLRITSIYGRFYEDPNERRIGVFCSIWTRERDGALQSAVKACVSRYQRQMEIGHTTLHQQAKEYWKNKYGLSEQEVESLPTLYTQYMKEREDDFLI
ncbi:MAG: hypothetical protein KME09_01550 [Pleurocapsa minor HA4230-MV1]|nr:hypothetical protein [Pleurocapsa minor HA4230-MV1]